MRNEVEWVDNESLPDEFTDDEGLAVLNAVEMNRPYRNQVYCALKALGPEYKTTARALTRNLVQVGIDMNLSTARTVLSDYDWAKTVGMTRDPQSGRSVQIYSFDPSVGEMSRSARDQEPKNTRTMRRTKKSEDRLPPRAVVEKGEFTWRYITQPALEGTQIKVDIHIEADLLGYHNLVKLLEKDQ